MQILSVDLGDMMAVNGIIDVYRAAFGNAPWNEGYKCEACESVFPMGISAPTCCKSCGGTLVEFWPAEVVLSDFQKEMKKPKAVCFVALENSSVVGFVWGYEVKREVSLSTYLDAPDVHTCLTEEHYFYLDECAVEPTMQRKGAGKLLIKEILSKQECEHILLRTLNDSPMRAIISKFGGSILQHSSRERVIMYVPRSNFS